MFGTVQLQLHTHVFCLTRGAHMFQCGQRNNHMARMHLPTNPHACKSKTRDSVIPTWAVFMCVPCFLALSICESKLVANTVL